MSLLGSTRPDGSDTTALGVLAVTSTFRPAEVTGPLSHVDGETVVVDGDAAVHARALAAARETHAAIRRERPDVVLLDAFGVIGFVAALVCLLHRLPVVPRLVGDPWAVSDNEGIARARRSGSVATLAVEYAYVYLSRAVLAVATGFVTVSSDLAEQIVERTGIPPERVAVVPVPVSHEATGDGERARESLGVEAQHVLLTVTNLGFHNKYEGVVDTLAALGGLLETRSDLAYVVAGGGAYLDDLREHVDDRFADSSARDRIHVPGYVDGVFDCLAMADVFVYVSYIDGYPNAVLEAQSMGLPVVANPAFGMLDMVEDGENGYLVAPEDGAALADAVARLLDDPEARDRFGTAARRRVSRENDPAAVGDRLQASLSDILAASRREN